jgi:hypothetical protein
MTLATSLGTLQSSEIIPNTLVLSTTTATEEVASSLGLLSDVASNTSLLAFLPVEVDCVQVEGSSFEEVAEDSLILVKHFFLVLLHFLFPDEHELRFRAITELVVGKLSMVDNKL